MAKGDNKYLPEIEDDAQKFGYKSANLLHLKSKIQDFITENCQILDDAGIKVQVPAFKPIEGSIIEQHLDKHQPNWRELFDNFKQAYQAQNNKEILGSDTEGCLKKLQQSIIECFNKHDIEPSLFEQFLRENQLQADDLLMIRSTGIKEDKADMANPGGNESLPCKADIHQISQAIGQVAASYVGQKSLSQRLALNDQTITELPVMPVLIQKMIGQGLAGSNQSADLEQTAPVSGVMYSQYGATRLQVAPGHGEYVVNSKGLADNIYITPQSTIYREVAPKEFRLQATWNEADKKIDLQRQSNPAELKYQPSIDNKVAYSLHRLAQYVEQQYGKRMDIEFVYDPATKIINIVQARAIPQSKKRELEPSAISLTYLANPDNNITTIKGLQVITPEINKVALITDHSQMIICDTISQALTQFNQASNKENIKGIIVKQPAPDASHEAGFFNSQSLAVMQVADLEQVEQLFKENQHLLIDPQHSNIYQLPKERFTELAQQSNNIEQSLYDQGIIAKGIWASTLSGYVTVNDYSFPEQIQLSQEAVGVSSEKTIGQLVQEANNGNIESTNQLLSRAYQALAFKIPGQEPLGQTAAEGDKAQILRDNLTKLSSPSVAEKNDQLRASLGYSLTAMVDARKKGKITAELFKQIMISGAELSASLDTLQALPRDCDEQSKNKAYLQYFNVQKKFTGLMLATGGKNITVDSLASHSKQAQAREEMDQLINQLPASTKNKVTQNQKDYLLESLKLGDYLLNEDSKKRWQKFCLDICTNLDHNDKPDIVSAADLGTLVQKLVSLGVQQQWINYIFTQEKNLDKPIDTLKKFAVDFSKIDLEKLKNASDIIKTMESQIGEWSDPGKFKKLYDELQENLKEINENLELDVNSSQLEKILILQQVHHLVDIMDKTIKSLECSNLYSDQMKDEQGNNLQVARFKDMINQFHGQVMTYCMQNSEYQDNQMLSRLKDSLNTKNSQQLTKSELSPSPNFNVSTATIDIPGITSRPSTLEDYFTLIHQNCLVALASATKDLNKIIERQYPDLVSQLNKKFIDREVIDNDPHGNGLHPITPSTSLVLQDNKLVITHNLRLRNHSAGAEIKYDNKTNITSLEFKIFGHNGLGRWDHVMLDNYLDLTKANCSFISKPYFDEEKLIVTFEVKLDDSSQITPIIEAINKSIEFGYSIHGNNSKSLKQILEKVIEERHQTLQFLYKNKPELKEELDKIDIIPGIPVKYDELQKIKENNIDNYNFLIQESHNLAKMFKINSLFTKAIVDDLYQKEPKEQTKYIMQHGQRIASLVNYGITLEEFVKMYSDETTRFMAKFLVDNIVDIAILKRSGFNAQDVVDWYIKDNTREKAEFFLENSDKIENLKEVGFDPQDLINWYDNVNTRAKAEFFIQNNMNISDLKKLGFSSQDLINWYNNPNTHDVAEFFIQKGGQVSELKKVGFDPQDLIDLYNDPNTHDKAKFLIENGYAVNRLSKKEFFNIEDLSELYDNLHTRNIAELLVNWDIYEICSRMEIDSKEFIKIYNNKGLETIKFLVSDNAMECYDRKWFTPQQLLHKDPKTIELLVSDNAYSYCCETEAGNYDNSMIDVEYSKLQYLLSDNAIKWYKERPCLFQELKTLPADVINGVLTQDNLETYQKAGNDCKNEKIAEIVLDEYLKYEIKDRGITQRQDDQRMLDMNHNVTSILSSFFPDIKEENIKKMIEPQISKLAANPNMELKQNIVTDIIKAIVIIEKSQKTLQANAMRPGANTGSVSTRASSPFSRLTQNFPGGR